MHKNKNKKQLICEILDIADRTFYKFKNENRPIIKLFENYFTEDDLQEFLNTGYISKLDNIDNIATLVKKQIDDKLDLPNTLQLFFIKFFPIIQEIYTVLNENEYQDFFTLLCFEKDKRDSQILNSNLKYKYLFLLIDKSPFLSQISSDLHNFKYDHDFYSSIINNVNLSFTQKKDYLNHFLNFCKFR